MCSLFGPFFYPLEYFNAFRMAGRIYQIEIERVRIGFHHRKRADVREPPFAFNEIAIFSHHRKFEFGPTKAAELRKILSEEVAEIGGVVIYKSGDERRHEVDYNLAGLKLQQGRYLRNPSKLPTLGIDKNEGNVRGLEQ